MNEEIKEILDIIKKCYEMYEDNEHWKILLDYITNLQQLYENGLKVNQNSHKYITELEMNNAILEEELKNRPIVDFTFDVYKELEDYKSRCEGTINLIDRTIEIIKQQPTKDDSWILSRLYGFKYVLNKGDEK